MADGNTDIDIDALHALLKKYYGFSHFRSGQLESISTSLSGQDCLVVMPTGHGKSACFVLPALYKKKTSIVVSPLISLMQDQVSGLVHKGIRAAYLGSAQEDRSVFVKATEGDFDVLFVTPELLDSDFGLEFLDKMKDNGDLGLIAIDEAHSICEWGHDFRPAYAKLGILRDKFPDVPMLAVTATATEENRVEIQHKLKFRPSPSHPRGKCIALPLDRPNIAYEAKMRSASLSADLRYCISRIPAGPYICDDVVAGATIIYVNSRKDTELIADTLKSEFGCSAAAYHAGMTMSDRTMVLKKFMNDEMKVIVATIAFGMGIDKKDIRCVVHYGPPKSVEAYVQQSGRCGRDGHFARCILLWRPIDSSNAVSFAMKHGAKQVEFDSLEPIRRYCFTSKCRRRFLLERMAETEERLASLSCSGCDNCNTNGFARSKDKYDLTSDANIVMKAMYDVSAHCSGNYGRTTYKDMLMGKKGKRVVSTGASESKYHGEGKRRGWSDEYVDMIFDVLEDVRLLSWNPARRGTLFINTENQVPGFVQYIPKRMADYIDRKARVEKHRGAGFTSTLPVRVIDRDADVDADGSSSVSVHINIDSPSKSSKRERPSSSFPSADADSSSSIPIPTPIPISPLSPGDKMLLSNLLDIRRKLAEENAVRPHDIVPTVALEQIARTKPTLEDLKSIEGVDERAHREYGASLLSVFKLKYKDDRDDGDRESQTLKKAKVEPTPMRTALNVNVNPNAHISLPPSILQYMAAPAAAPMPMPKAALSSSQDCQESQVKQAQASPGRVAAVGSESRRILPGFLNSKEGPGGMLGLGDSSGSPSPSSSSKPDVKGKVVEFLRSFGPASLSELSQRLNMHVFAVTGAVEELRSALEVYESRDGQITIL